MSVELRVNLRIAQAEVGAKIDETDSSLEERHRELGGNAVRQGEKSGLGTCRNDRLDLRIDEGKALCGRRTGEAGKDRGESPSGLLT